MRRRERTVFRRRVGWTNGYQPVWAAAASGWTGFPIEVWRWGGGGGGRGEVGGEMDEKDWPGFPPSLLRCTKKCMLQWVVRDIVYLGN